MPPLRPEIMTWTALLARWTELAQASLALPADAEGDRWRASVPAIIRLQAVVLALADLGLLAAADRPYARDRAEVLVRDSVLEIERAWKTVPLPAMLIELLDDARLALELAPWRGAVELLWPGPGPLVIPALPVPEGPDSLALMQPGTIAMPGEPVAWWIGDEPADLLACLPGCEREEPAVPHQVYRVLDEAGCVLEDVLAEVTADPVAGLPLLVPIRHAGASIGRFTVEAERWREQQERALAGRLAPVRSA